MPVLLLANLLLGVYYNFSIWYRLKDRTGLGAWISIAGAVITILLNLVLIPLYGFTGAAWVTLVCYTFMSAATWFTGQKHYPVPYEIGRMALYVLLVFVLWFVHQILQPALAGLPVVLWAMRVVLLALFAGAVYLWEIRKPRLTKIVTPPLV